VRKAKRERHISTNLAVAPSRPQRPLRGDSVEEVGFHVLVMLWVGAATVAISGVRSGRRDRYRYRDQLGEFTEVMGGGGEVEFVSGAVGLGFFGPPRRSR
jgi:hypothetical protein